MRRYKTIIIGGGIAGLGCGRQLHKHSHDFLLLTKDLGGRMLSSKDHKTNYGASYITEEYRLTSEFIGKGERIRLNSAYFFDGRRWTNIFRLRNFWTFLNTRSRIKKLVKEVRGFRKKCLDHQQKDVITPFLRTCVNTPANEFVKENNLGYLHENFARPVLESTFFTKMDRVNLFQYFVVLFPAVIPTYRADFTDTVKKLTAGWEDRIKLTPATSLKKTKNGYIVKAGKSSYEAENIVLALPYNKASKLTKVPKPKFSPMCYAWHIKGMRKDPYKKMKIVFFDEKNHGIYCIWGQEDGSDLIFSKRPSPDLSQFYSKHKVIEKVFWNPAVVISGSKWVKQKLSNNLFIAGDYNICCLEDAYITGVYAANHILGQCLGARWRSS